jgi:hypothetical protein
MRPTCPERLSAARPIFREIPAPVRPSPVGSSTAGDFDLPADALWSIDPHQGLTIHCAQGQLWITQAGDGRDIVLASGEAFAPRSKGRVVIQALSDSRIQLA